MTNFSGENLNAGCGGPQGGGVDSRRNGVSEVSPKYLAEVASNAIRSGYKQTEVGVIPEDWDVVPIGSLCTIFGRIGFRGYTKSDIVDEDQGVLSISPSNILHGTVSFDHGTYISWSKYHESPEIQIFNGDVLLVKTGSTYGKVGLVNSLDREATLNPQVVVLKKIKCPSSLLAYVMQFELVQNQIEETIVGGAIPTLSQKAVANYLVPIPIKQSEQTAIANALSDVDALISGLEKLIAKKQAIKTATMQQLLTGRTRLPQFALREDGTPKGTKPSELGEMPEDWEVVCFEQLKDKKDNWAITGGPFGSNLKSSDYTENGVRVIQLQNIGDGEFKNDDFVYTSYQKANELISCNIYPDEIILSKMGDPVARACLIPHFHSRYVMCSDGIRLKVDNQKYTEKFVYYFLNYPLFRNQAFDASTGSTRKRIGLSELRALSLFAPPKEEQSAIASILSDMDEEIKALEQRLSKTRQIKQGMMQELLTGKTRLV